MKIWNYIECRVWGLALLLLFGFLAPMTLLAQQTWTYSGQVLEGTSSGENPLETPVDITGTVVLATALNSNQANQIVTPLSYSFDGSALLSSSASLVQGNLFPAALFEFSTVNGAVTAWSVALYGNGQDYTDSLSLTMQGDAFSNSESDGRCIGEHNCGVYMASNSVAGAWVDPPNKVQAPELSTDVAAITLLICGVAVMKGRRHS